MNRRSQQRTPCVRLLELLPMLAWTLLLSLFFAQVEIQIEGGAGWAANLPTWRIEHHWLLDLFWGSRAMTGYHVYVFTFVALFFHFPLAFARRWSWRSEARALACILLFWIAEDFLWFAMNPAFGLARFTPSYVSWHVHWLWGVPVDYWISLLVIPCLLHWSARTRRRTVPSR